MKKMRFSYSGYHPGTVGASEQGLTTRQEKMSLIKITILEVTREFHSLIRISTHSSIYLFIFPG